MTLLLVSDRKDLTEKLKKLLTEQGYLVGTAVSAPDAGNTLDATPYDLVLLVSPLEGALGDALAKTLTEKSSATVIILAPLEIADRMREKVAGKGIFVVDIPLKKQELLDTLKAAAVSSERIRSLFSENASLKKQLAEVKLIEHAKVLLVECLKLSEDQAHKYLEREAMELRQSRVEVAKRVISTYQS